MNPNVEYKIVTGDAAREVLQYMLADQKTGRQARQSLKMFVQYVDRYRIDVSRQPAAYVDGKIAACVLLIVSPGATASVFLPEENPSIDPADPAYRGYLTGLLGYLKTQMEPLDLGLIQTTLLKEDAEREQLFLDSGFEKLCNLEIMESGVLKDRCAKYGRKIIWLPFGPETSARFGQVILSSYEGTEDCPSLSGLRTMKEILEGHRYSGIFEPRGWWLMQYEDRDAGVILLNRTEEVQSRLELVYMGLAPWARGQGLGHMLLGRAFEVSTWLDKKVIRLAVDQKNTPALQLYRRSGFLPVARQVILAVINEARRERLAAANL
jgi:GNAT superfamily N-acetyltransferase